MNILIRVGAAILTGALLAQAFSLGPFWPIAWLAPVPLLIALNGSSRLGALGYGALAGALSTALLMPYFLGLAGPIDAAVVVLVTALIWAGMAIAARTAQRRLPDWAGVFVFPALLAGFETAFAAVSPHGSSGSLAYSQMDFIAGIQVASLGGAPAITFVVALLASALALVIVRRRIAPVLAPALIVALALGWGAWRVQTAPAGGAPTSFAMLAADRYEIDAPDWRPAWDAYAAAAEAAAGEGARVIVLPEKIAVLPPPAAREATARLQAIAARHDAIIVAGAVAPEDEAIFNRAYLITANGVQSYDKHHMVPGFESHLTVGTAITFADIGETRVGVAICKDLDFPALMRRYGDQQVELMLVPAWDFTDDAWLHSRMAVLRGVENGFTLVRSARDGYMTVTDNYGRLLAQADSAPDVATLMATAPIRSGRTLYARIGDTFGWAMLALALVLIGWALVSRPRAA